MTKSQFEEACNSIDLEGLAQVNAGSNDHGLLPINSEMGGGVSSGVITDMIQYLDEESFDDLLTCSLSYLAVGKKTPC